MAINKKLIHFKNKEKFDEELANGNILDTSIVFIKDTKQIYTHGQLYDGSTFDPTDIEASILNIIDNYATKTEIPTKVSQLENDANYIQDDGVSDGVYAVDASGKLIDYNLADATALGVVLVAGEHKFMIAKADATDGINETLYWNKSYSDLSLTNYTNAVGTNSFGFLPKPDGTFGGSTHLSGDFTTWTAGALSDFNGKANTAVITEASSDDGDMCTVLNTFNAATDGSNADKNDWYVPALGQLALIYLNKTEINKALTKIGGTAFATDYSYWSSSEKLSYSAWFVNFDNGGVDGDGKGNWNCRVRFVRDISVSKPLKERVSELETSKQDVIKDLETIRSGAAKKMLDNITYSELVTLRDNSQLIPGKQYRITDYITTTTQAETQSAGHLFDVIVIADTVNILNETARITNHEGDTYFANENLAAFLIKYCLDNDISRFSWADTANGKGVIYYMKDQHNNETPYDFKNIQFKRYKVLLNNEYCVDYKSYIENDYVGFKPMNSSGARMHPDLSIADESDFKWYYTFSRLTDETDASINSEGKVHDNVILPVVMDDDNLETLSLNNIVLITNMIICENKFNDCCFLMTFIGNGDIGCNYIGSYSIGNILKDCLQNYIGNNFQRNIIISDFTKSNTIGLFFTENIALSRMIARNDFDHGCNNNIFIAIKEITINKFFTECKNNIIVTTGLLNRNHAKAQFSNNVINCSNFITNTIGYGFKSNIITEGNFAQNTIGHNCANNIFNTFMNSVVNFGFKNNTFKISSDINSEDRVRVNDCYFGSGIQYNNFYSTEPNTSDYRIQNLKVQSMLQGTSSAINNIEVPCNAINEITVAKDNNNNIIVSNIQSQIGDINTILESIINS